MLVDANEIDALLPQTQCGLCQYPGCMPYAKAMAAGEASINLCPPGGVATLKKLGELLNIDSEPFIAEMQKKAKPSMLALIRESECIGCTKCIQACPVDAILGSAKSMHTVISDECTGCELCIPPCPVDCIDLAITANANTEMSVAKSNIARERFNNREQRLRLQLNEKEKKLAIETRNKKQQYIQHAIARVKAKKINQTNS